jgi:mRNA interferase YafQ
VRTFSRTNRFKKDVERARARGKNLGRLRTVVELLIDERALPPQLKDHPLKGEWAGSRDCHIEPDWVLIYTLEGNHVRFERTGTHADLFE